MKRVSIRSGSQQGVALLTAIGLLLVFSVLGTAYLRYMALEVEKARTEDGRLRARYAAEGAVYTAVSAIKQALNEKKVAELIKQSGSPTAFPVYAFSEKENGAIVADDKYAVSTTWAVRDESGKLNLNHAPASALQVILGVDGAKAREIRASLPRTEEGASQSGEHRWFSSVDDLVYRGLVSAEMMKKVDANSLTVYTVPDPDAPLGYINLNTASPKVLEAVLDVPPAVAQAVAAARPFYSLADVCQAANKPATMFNFKPDPESPDSMPKALALESNAFRVYARSQVKRAGGAVLGTASVEAVVVFRPDGKFVFTYWKEEAGEKSLLIDYVQASSDAGTSSAQETKESAV